MQLPNKPHSQQERAPSRSSILGLDALTFLMADVRDGVGPYLSVFLKGGLQWQSGEIGIAMAASSITAAICQIPAGLLVDSVRVKRFLVLISGLMMGVRSRKWKLKHCKGSVILVNDQRSATLSDKPNARKRKGSQHPDLR
jgi:MFS family permease